MKNLPKILTKLFLLIFVLQILFLTLFLTSSQQALATQFTPQISIGTDFQAGEAKNITETSIGEYIAAIYKYAIGIVGILATVILMYGGVRWITSGGNSEKIGDAKAWIGAALSGLVLALASFLILATINPALVEIQSISPTPVSKAPTTGIKTDPNVNCGTYDQQTGKCGTKCSENESCEKVSANTEGAIRCPITLDGGGEYWRCTTLSQGGRDCCANNNDADCREGFICNMGISNTFGGVTLCEDGKTHACTTKQSDGGSCAESADCIDGLECISKRCGRILPQSGEQCNNGNCDSGLYCYGRILGMNHPGTCFKGSHTDYCEKNSQCQSGSCVNIDCWNQCLRDGYHRNICAENECKESGCNPTNYKCACS